MNTLKTTLDMTFRIFVLLFAITIGLMFVMFGAKMALAASLKPNVIVSGSVFTVGDIFAGLSEETASKVLGPAPAPGNDMVLNARTLMRIAIALDLPWQPGSSTETVTISRKASIIDAGYIREALREPLKEKGADGEFDLSFYGVSAPEIILPADQPADMELGALNFDKKSGRFEAEIYAPSKSHALVQTIVSGKIERVLEVPVLKRSLSRGDIIGAADIHWINVKAAALQNDTILDAEDLIGMTPRRLMVSGLPVRDTELEMPKLISRGDIVTIMYNVGPLNLTAKGRALQNGAKNGLIRVSNIASNQTVEAVVKDQGVVSVSQ